MPDKNGVRYLRTHRKAETVPPFRPAGTLYRRLYPDGSSNDLWVLDDRQSTDKPLPRWLATRIASDDFDGGNV